MEKEAAGIKFQTDDDEPRRENLMHFVNVQTLMEEHRKQSRKKATGIDGVTKEEYNANIDANLEKLVEQMKQFRYRPMPVRRTYIPKANGKLRPLGIPAYEDKLVQGAMAKLLEEV
jgi:retron-type reverse transcriptase